MTLLNRIIDRAFRLPPPSTRDIEVRKGLRIPAHDGAELLADLYLPRRTPDAPTLLVRTPYGRSGLLSRLAGRPFAERGYNVVVAACRGTDGSGGTFDPMADDDSDGLATLDWIEKEPWHNGTVVLYGPSYLGYTQLAMAPEAGNRVAAIMPMITTSAFRDIWYEGDSFSLAAALAWTAEMAIRDRRSPLAADILTGLKAGRVRTAMQHLPLNETDKLGTGQTSGWFQDWLVSNEPGDPYWGPKRDHRARIGNITTPTLLFGGWYDIILPGQLADYAAMRAAGRQPYLTIGPWAHATEIYAPSMQEALPWFAAHTRGDHSGLRDQPVRLYVQGAGEWREYPDWPPPGITGREWHLQPGRGLSPDRPADGPPDRFRYNPADPTPSVGGPLLDPKAAGRKDNAKLEARADVLVYTSEPLREPAEVIGPVSARIQLRSSQEHADVFVRLCDVDPRGRSFNVCDGLQRITPQRFPASDDGTRTVPVRLWPTAYRFQPGHRLRVQISGGAFPRLTRNPGTGEPLATATRTVPVDYEIRHSSSITLPVLPARTPASPQSSPQSA
jgi:putative CocE/NonD family hydrolase